MTVARALRYCDVCGQLDDHPRHVIGLGPHGERGKPTDEFLASIPDGPPKAAEILLDPTSLCRHHDCCASLGCEVCQATEALHGGVRGSDLIASIDSGVAADLDTTGMSVGGLDG